MIARVSRWNCDVDRMSLRARFTQRPVNLTGRSLGQNAFDGLHGLDSGCQAISAGHIERDSDFDRGDINVLALCLGGLGGCWN